MKKKNLVFGGVLGNKRKNIKNYIFNKKNLLFGGDFRKKQEKLYFYEMLREFFPISLNIPPPLATTSSTSTWLVVVVKRGCFYSVVAYNVYL